MSSEIRIPRRAIAPLAIAILVLLFLAVPQPRDALGAAWRSVIEPRPTADPVTLAAQRDAAERAIAGAHANALIQIGKARQLQLAITATQADAIQERAVNDLKTLRHNALLAVAASLRLPADYVPAAEARSDAGKLVGDGGTLLAPALTAAVARNASLVAARTDAAIREITGPAQAQSPSPSAAAPSPTATRSASPSPR